MQSCDLDFVKDSEVRAARKQSQSAANNFCIENFPKGLERVQKKKRNPGAGEASFRHKTAAEPVANRGSGISSIHMAHHRIPF